jgi:hypothetical protein
MNCFMSRLPTLIAARREHCRFVWSLQQRTKEASLACAVILSGLTSLAQGQIAFNNRAPGTIVTHVYAPLAANPTFHQTGNGTDDFPAGGQDWSGFKAIGSGGIDGEYGGATIFAQLLGASGFDQPEASLLPGHPTTTFRTGAAGGFVAPITVVLDNVFYSQAATVEMVAWDNRSGLYPSWTEAEIAWQRGEIAAGKIPPWNQFVGGLGSAPPSIWGAASFNLYFLPEPSPFALAGLAGAVWLGLRLRTKTAKKA